jgi:hypothetical protein
MKSHFVTCIYDGLHGSKLCGRLNRLRQYRLSLETIARTGVDITCYTSPHELNSLKEHFNVTMDIKNIEFIPFDLHSAYFHKDVDTIRDSNDKFYRKSPDWMHRCVEVMWSKFIFIKEVIKNHPDLDHVYWIDAGISHSGIIHSRFNPFYDHNFKFFMDLDKSKNHLPPKNYLIFNEDFMPNLVRYTGETHILNLAVSGNQHFRLPTVKGKYKGSVIGGIFGGNTGITNEYCDKMIELFEEYTESGVLHKEEQLMTRVLTEDTFPTKLFVFDTWYHADWDEGYYKPNLREFSDFFDEITQQ